MPVWRDDQGHWHAQASWRGQRVHRRCPAGATKGDAQRLAAELKRALWRAAELGDRPAVLISQALEAHLVEIAGKRSGTTARYHALRIEPWIRGLAIEQAPDAAHRIVADLRAHYAPATINRSLAALKRACRIAWERGWCEQDVSGRIHLVAEHNARHRYLTAREIEAVCQADPGIADAVRILAYTGMRLGELLGLAPEQIRDGEIRLDTRTKTGRPRAIPIAEPIREAVARLPLTMARRTLQQRFVAACTVAGLAGVHLHDLRHTTASLLVQAGESLPVIGALLGHTSPQTTARYAHLVQDQLRAAIKKLG